jgi:hypothetical protein
MNKTLIDELNRLVRLSGTDEGFFILAIHSFIEGLANSIRPDFTLYAGFNDVIDLLMGWLEARQRLSLSARRALVRMAKQHQLTHDVRHRFGRATQDDVATAIGNFREICLAFSLSSPALDIMDEGLTLWNEGKPPVALARELKQARLQLSELEAGWAQVQEKVEGYAILQQKLALAEALVLDQGREVERVQATADQRAEKNDELRSRLREATSARDAIRKELEKHQALRDYLGYLERFTTYTRTRTDYERSVMKLTPEQEEAAVMVREAGDYVLKGAAGTGKTLVLLHALERHLQPGQGSLELGFKEKIVLLTFTNTLAKYSRYLADIVGRSNAVPLVSTADSFILEALRKIESGAWIDFKAPGNLVRDYNSTSFLTDEELAVEVEDVIWGNLISRQEYLDKHILRKGMRQPLSSAQRELVWAIQERLREALAGERRYTKNLACQRIARHIESQAQPVVSRVDRIFVDEAQDLSTATIRVLGLLSLKGLVLAADDGQSIYKIGAQYLRAGLKVAGHVRILKTNFRNTRQIRDLAEDFLALGRGSATTAEEGPRAHAAYREGPLPELVQAASQDKLMDAVAKQVAFCCDRLGYDPENIGVLAPTNAAIEQIRQRLKRLGYDSASIKDDGFEFTKPGVVRLSTLYSSKGLEFPVVLVYVPVLGVISVCDERHLEAMQRNLLYVALTRAMDQVILFTLDQPTEKPLAELAGLVQAGFSSKDDMIDETIRGTP